MDVLARARTFATMQDIMAYYRAGYIRGGTESCALIAMGDKWWNPPMLLPAEPARHKLLDLIGRGLHSFTLELNLSNPRTHS